VEELQRIFQFFDTDASGTVTLQEIERQMSMLGFKISIRSMEEVVGQASADLSGELSFPAFVVAMLSHVQKVRTAVVLVCCMRASAYPGGSARFWHAMGCFLAQGNSSTC
jgi:hypothetical protein